MRRARVPVTATWETRLLAIVTMALVAFGVAAVYGASSIVAVQNGNAGWSLAFRQGLGALAGGLVLVVVSRLDYHVWQRVAWPLLILSWGMALVLLVPWADPIVVEQNGARRWLGLPGATFQPAELAKFAVVVWVAMLATKKATRIREFQKGLVPFLVILLPLAATIALEPALSNAVLLVLVAGAVLFAAGARISHFFVLGVAALPVLWYQVVNTGFRNVRWLNFLGLESDPSRAGWQIEQSLIGIGAGGLFGLGYGEGLQKLGYLPYAYSDFVFSSIGEEWGFAGVLALLLAFGTYIWLGLRIARTARDRFGTLLATGCTALVALTATLHIAVTLGTIPTTGLPLPFVSYGRSNLLVSLLATGIIMNVGEARSGEARG